MKTLCSILVGLMAATGVTPLTAVTVTSLNDSGPGSLRAALGAGGHIDFAVTGTITLTSGELVVNHSTTITGPGAEQLTIARSGADGTPAFRVLKVLGSPVTISGLTVRNGLVAETHDNGAGILNQGSLTLNDCVVRGNRATNQLARGAGLFNADHATLTLNRCVVAENVVAGEYSSGGGMYAYGTVSVNDSTFRGNRGEGWHSRGGGLNVDYYGRAGVARSTFSGNAAIGKNAAGGGIYNFGRLEIVNSTLSGNTAGDTGGGMQSDGLAPNTAIRNCTISGNSARAGAGLYDVATLGTVADSIIAGNSPDDLRCAGILVSSGHNLFGQVGGSFIVPAPGDQLGVTADALKLEPLANNGGPTQTRALLAGSPAIDAGKPTSFPATDQRGVARPFGPRPDIGAFELDVILPPLVTVSATQSNTTEMGPTILVAPGVFTISRSGGTNEPLRVFYRLSGTASNGVDYQHLSNSVIIAAGQRSAQLRILAFFDQLVEGTERVVLHLEAPACPAVYPPPPGCYTAGTPAEAVVNIQDYNQPANRPPTVQIFTPANNQWFTAGEDIFIAAQAQDLDGYDTIKTVEFFAGEHSLGITTNFPTMDPIGPFRFYWQDVLPGQYILKALATDDHGATAWSEPVRITVFDAMLSRVTLRASDPHASEAGDPGAFTIAREGATNYALAVFYAIGGTASNGVDYVVLSGHVTLAAGERETTIPVAPVNDSIHEGTERVELRLQPAPVFLMPYVIASPRNGVVNIVDNDEPLAKPVITITANDAQASETPGNPGQFRIHRSGPTNQTLQLYLAISGTASNGVDYARLTNFVVIPAGRSAVEFVVAPIDDNLFEGTETVVATLYFPPVAGPQAFPYVIGSPSNAIVTIADNDEPSPLPVVTIEAPHPTASETPGNPGLIHIYRTGPTNHSLSVYCQFSGAASNGLDFASLANPVVIPAGRSFVRVAVVPVDDNLFEGNETVVATLHHPLIAIPPTYVIGSPSNATVTILDNDPSVPPFEPAVVTIVATDPQARETGLLTVLEPGRFTIRRSGNTNVTLHVQCVIDGTASNGVDYISLSNIVIIPAGVTSVSVPVYPLNDNLTEGTEIVALRLQNPACITIVPPPPECYQVGTPGAAMVFISDPSEPEPLPVVTITVRDPVASEGTNCVRWVGWANTPPSANFCGTNTATFVVRRSGSTNEALTVVYEISGTASNGVDYLPLPGVVTIPAGRRAAEISIVPVDDALREHTETIRLTLRPASSAPDSHDARLTYTIGWPARAGAILVDNDQPRPGTGPLPDRSFHLMRPGNNGSWFRIESSTNLIHWTALCTNVVTDGAIHFIDPDSDDLPSRFYRAVPEVNPPAE